MVIDQKLHNQEVSTSDLATGVRTIHSEGKGVGERRNHHCDLKCAKVPIHHIS